MRPPEGSELPTEPGSTLFLVQRARADETDEAWNRLVQKIESRVRGHHRAQSIPASFTADDLVQETLKRTFLGLSGMELRDRDAFWGWVLRISDHALIDLVRRERALKRGAGRSTESLEPAHEAIADESSEAAHSVVQVHELRDALLGCLKAQGERYETVLRARLFEQLPYEEIAKRSGFTNESTVRSLFKRGQGRLQACLKARGIVPTASPAS